MQNRKLDRLLALSPKNMNRADRRNAQRLIKEEIRRIENMKAADQMSGAGYPIDVQLRRTLKMVNEDTLSGQQVPLPKLIDMVGAFFQVRHGEIVPVYTLRTEKDHAFDGNDFFTYATEPELREQTIPALMSLPEGVIHNYTAISDPKDIQFEQEDGDSVVISGISMIRSGDFLYWQTAGGSVTDLDNLTAQRRAEIAENADKIRAANPHAPEAQLASILNPTAEPLPGSTDIWNCAAYGLFNLRTQRHEMRATSKEWTVSQAVFSDQFETRYADLYESDEAVKRMVDKAMIQIDKDHLFFEVAETALILPAYFNARVEFVRTDEVRTELGRPSGGDKRKHAMRAPVDMRILMRSVATLDLGRRQNIDRSYTPPRYQVEVEGFYRRLEPEAIGRDAEGAPIRGMTWVKKHARWKDRPRKMGVVHLKTTIASAMERAKKMADKVGGSARLRAAT